MVRERRTSWLSCVSLCGMGLLANSGCGGVKTVPVTGTVTLDGKTLDGVSIVFVPTEQEGKQANGRTDASGTFTLSSVGADQGALPGSSKVGLSKLKEGPAEAGKAVEGQAPKGAPAGTMLSGPGGGGPGKGGMQKPAYALPVKYTNPNTSGITVEVKAGMDPVKIELKSN